MTRHIEGAGQTTYVVQGEFAVSSNPGEQLSTILGSCVAACLHDPVMRVGGMNHFLLPFGPDEGTNKPVRYGVNAMEMLLNALFKQGAQKSRLQAKLFGAARISATLRDVGQSNADFAREFLASENIPCIADSLGGNAARRLVYQPSTGRARLLIVPNIEVEQLNPKPLPIEETQQADVTLF